MGMTGSIQINFTEKKNKLDKLALFKAFLTGLDLAPQGCNRVAPQERRGGVQTHCILILIEITKTSLD